MKFRIEDVLRARNDLMLRGLCVGKRFTLTHQPSGLQTVADWFNWGNEASSPVVEKAYRELQRLVEAEPIPRIYWSFYPKLGYGLWRVSPLPKPYSRGTRRQRWDEAYSYINQLNERIKGEFHDKERSDKVDVSS